MIDASERIEPVTRAQVWTLFSRGLEILDQHPEMMMPNVGRSGFADRAEPWLKEFPALVTGGSLTDILLWTRELNEQLRRTVADFIASIDAYEPDANREIEGIARSYISQLEADNQTAASLEDTFRFREQAEGSAEAAQAAAEAAQSAAGITGGARLAQHFSDYADRELFTANMFRIFVVCAIVLGVAAAYLLPHPQAEDIIGLAFRGLQILAAAGLVFYLAGQATQHRRNGNWARALEVQLMSFSAFSSPISDEQTRAAIYDIFARRVLGPPPEKGAKENAAGIDPQLLEVVLTLLKRV